MRSAWGPRWFAVSIVAWVLPGCRSLCDEPCDPLRVAQRIGGSGATECGVAIDEREASAVHECMASAFAADRAFLGLVEIPTTTADGVEVVLVRGFARGSDRVLREVLGTRQPDGAVVHTRICFSAVVRSDDEGVRLRCIEGMDGLFIECECSRRTGTDAGQP